jgi:hypothetical protein
MLKEKKPGRPSYRVLAIQVAVKLETAIRMGQT